MLWQVLFWFIDDAMTGVGEGLCRYRSLTCYDSYCVPWWEVLPCCTPIGGRFYLAVLPLVDSFFAISTSLSLVTTDTSRIGAPDTSLWLYIPVVLVTVLVGLPDGVTEITDRCGHSVLPLSLWPPRENTGIGRGESGRDGKHRDRQRREWAGW